MKIYADPITVNCRKVLAGMKLLDVDYTLEKIDYFTGEQKSEAYVAINPNAALPALTDGDLVLWESNAILQYAADKHGKTKQYPAEPARRCWTGKQTISTSWRVSWMRVSPQAGGCVVMRQRSQTLPWLHRCICMHGQSCR